MATNKELIQRLHVGKSTFYLADFHVHSPASFDIRTGEHFERLSGPIKDAIMRGFREPRLGSAGVRVHRCCNLSRQKRFSKSLSVNGIKSSAR